MHCGPIDPEEAAQVDLDRLALRVQMPGFPGARLGAAEADLLAAGLGSVCLYGSNTSEGPEAVQALTSAIHDAASGAAVIAVDEEGGDVTRLHVADLSPVPGAAQLGVIDDLTMTRWAGGHVGAELAALGIGLVLAPVADLNTDPGNPVIGVRSFGTDPAAVSRHVTAWVEGVQGQGVAACAKHFPGHGDTRVDSHLGLPTIDIDEATLRARELVPFAAAVRAGVATVMTGHLVVPALDRGLPASLSPAAHVLLREDLGFTGAVVSDALDMAGASSGRGIPGAAVAALRAGADLLCLGSTTGAEGVEAVRRAIVAAVRGGELSEQRLVAAAAAVERLLTPPPVTARAEAHADPVDALRRSVVVDGVLPDLAGAFVVSIVTEPSLAVGTDAAWGLAADRRVDASRPGAVEEILSAAGRRPVLLQVRDAHRHAEVVALTAAVAGRTSAVVVEWGWPGPWDGRVTRVQTYGSSRPGRDALADMVGLSARKGRA